MEKKIRIKSTVMTRIDLVFIIIGIPRTTWIIKWSISIAISDTSVGKKPEGEDDEDGSGHCDLDLPPRRDQEIQQQGLDHGVWASQFHPQKLQIRLEMAGSWSWE